MDFAANNGFHKQKEAVNKRILFLLDKNSDSTNQNEGFAKKIRRGKTAFIGRNIERKPVKNGLQ